MTEQPTEQCVHTFLRVASCAPAGGGGPASAWRRLVSGSAPRVARPPAARPERRRKARRSRPPSAGFSGAAVPERRLPGRVRLISTGVPSLVASFGRIAVDAVEVLHLRRVGLIFGLAPVLIAGRKRVSLAGERSCQRAADDSATNDSATKRSKKRAPPKLCWRSLAFGFLHGRHTPQVADFARSRRQREGLRFDVDEGAAERADRPVEVGCLGALQVGE